MPGPAPRAGLQRAGELPAGCTILAYKQYLQAIKERNQPAQGAGGATWKPMSVKSPTGFEAFHLGLAVMLAGLSVWAAILPVSRFDWLMENVLVWIAAAVMASSAKKTRFSRRAYLLIALFLAMQIYGSHYAYQPEIGSWISSVFDSPRNSYDRVMHLAFGCLLFIPMTEGFHNVAGLSRKTAMLCSVLAIVALGAAYEIIEWGMMIVLAPQAGAEFVGAQGDPWDAQKDMALALLGSVSTYLGARLWQRKRASA